MATTKYMGRNQLIKRLTAQVGSEESALKILRQRGHVDAKGNLTSEGRKRDAMTAEERAIDRSSKKYGRNPDDFTYNPQTNTASLRKGK
jgi:hypothetical protein